MTLPITKNALDWLDNYIKPHMIIFEYCSGDSTHYFRKKAHSVISIEYHPNNYNTLSKNLTSHSNHILKLIEPVKDLKSYPYSHESFGSTDKAFLYHNFTNYVNSINDYNDYYFDIVLISGRARAACIKTALPKIKKEGILILNDSERYIYQDAINLFLSKCTKKNYGEDIKKTSIYTIK